MEEEKVELRRPDSLKVDKLINDEEDSEVFERRFLR